MTPAMPSDGSILPHPTPATSVEHRWAGAWVLGIWLGCAIWAFWILEGRPLIARTAETSAPQRVEAVEAWARELGLATGALALVHREAACACPSGRGQAQLDPAVEAARRGIAVHAVPSGSAPMLDAVLPSSAAWLLFGADGRLHYAGPAESSDLCGSRLNLLAQALQRSNANASPPRYPILPADCVCS